MSIAIFLGLVLIAAIAVVLLGIVLYNQLVRSRQMVAEGWSGIDVQLKKRANLVPNLVETVKDLLEKVTELRSQSLQATDPVQKGAVEGALGRTLANILAVAEQYPDLKANENFLDLQTKLNQIENDIEMARRYYNGTVRNLNIKVDAFPSSIVARKYGFEKATFFKIEDPRDRETPAVDF